jgi:hypothetical protein
MLASLFPQQRAFVEDQSRLKAVVYSRRSGKSWAVGVAICCEALSNPGCRCLYAAGTRGEAKKIMWDDVPKRLDASSALGCTFNESELSMAFPNCSRAYLFGANANSDERTLAKLSQRDAARGLCLSNGRSVPSVLWSSSSQSVPMRTSCTAFAWRWTLALSRIPPCPGSTRSKEPSLR